MLLLPITSLLLSLQASPQASMHTVKFTFSYDFRVTPACSPVVKEKCIQQFNLYEISNGVTNRVKLGSVPPPPGAAGLVKNITATTKPFLFTTGRHMIGVTAQMANGTESDFIKGCTTIIKIR